MENTKSAIGTTMHTTKTIYIKMLEEEIAYHQTTKT